MKMQTRSACILPYSLFILLCVYSNSVYNINSWFLLLIVIIYFGSSNLGLVMY